MDLWNWQLWLSLEEEIWEEIVTLEVVVNGNSGREKVMTSLEVPEDLVKYVKKVMVGDWGEGMVVEKEFGIGGREVVIKPFQKKETTMLTKFLI